jgi:energy-coupling factor transport system permease protein
LLSPSLRKLDARTKLAVAAMFITGLLLVDKFIALLPVVAFLVAAMVILRIPARSVFMGLVGLCPLLVLTVLFHGMMGGSPNGKVVASTIFSLSGAGLVRGGFFAIRLVVFVFVSRVALFLGSGEEYGRALGRLLSPLRHLRLPVGETELVLGIAFRFIPTLEQEANRLLLARRARGTARSWVGRIRQLPAILVPLFVGAFRRADALAIAMESRGFAVGVSRSSFIETHFRFLDLAVLISGAGITVLSILLS